MNTTSETILVTGATGKVGRRLTERLRRTGHDVRAVSRRTDIPFDWHDRTTWEAALDGVAAAYLIPPDEPVPTTELVAAAEAAGIRRLVTQSGRRIHLLTEAAGVGRQDIAMHALQEDVRASGVEWTVLQPNNFNQNFSEGDYGDAVRAGTLMLPLGDAVEPLIDVDDIAAVAAAVLTEDGHHGRIYELSGPESLSFGQALKTIAAAAGITTTFQSVGAEEFAAQLRADDAPEPLVMFLDTMFLLMRQGVIADVSDDVERVLGRPATGFADWAAAAAKDGSW